MSDWLSNLQEEIKNRFPEESKNLTDNNPFPVGTKCKSVRGGLGYEVAEVSLYLKRLKGESSCFIKPILRYRLKQRILSGLTCFYSVEELLTCASTT